MPDGIFVILATCVVFLAGLAVGLRRPRVQSHNCGVGSCVAANSSADAEEHAVIAQVSHEIRTPLTAILGFSEQLQAGGLSRHDEQIALRAIVRNSEHILHLINDVLDYSRIEAGRPEFRRTHCSPSEVIRDATEMVHGRAAMKGLTLVVEVSNTVPQSALMDPTRVRQILANLLSNAVKYTAVGGIRLSIAWTPAKCDAEEDVLQFDVIDSGVGMSEAEASSLFEAYFRGGSDLSRKQSGTGLGLSISRRLARRMGGDVTLVSTRPDGGSHFRATIPIGRPSPENAYEPTGPAGGDDAGPSGPVFAPLVGRRVLVAEDCTDSQRLLRFVLSKAGATVTVVSNGREAVDVAMAEAPTSPPFDAIVMDMQMPVMDGHTATRELRQRGFDRSIVALTAHAARGERERCIEAGCDEYLSKPFDRAALVSAVARSCGRVACEASS